jgi:hypothetical protein
MMKIINWKSWRLYVLLAGLLVVSGVTLIVCNDTVQFTCKLHFGSEKMQQDCLDRLYGDMELIGLSGKGQEVEIHLPPEWTWRHLVSDARPMTRIMTAKILWHLHPTEGKWLSALAAETDNPDSEVRAGALSEFWNMSECFETTKPILRKHLFEDKDELPRRSASLTLLTLSQDHSEARSILDEAAQSLRYESTKEFVKKQLKRWDKKTDIKTVGRTNQDSAINPR